jgi:hypothetical protein
MVFDFYVFWCELNSDTDAQLQTMLSNQLLYNWFTNQYANLELAFYDKIGGASTLPLKSIVKIYQETTLKIAEYYPPRQLLQKIRKSGKQTIENLITLN